MNIQVTNEDGLKQFNNNCNKGNWLVWYFAEWCGHCSVMKPEWEKFIIQNKKKSNTNVAMVRDDYVQQLNNPPQIQGYPSIMLYKNGKMKKTYEGERNSVGFNKFLSKNGCQKKMSRKGNNVRRVSRGRVSRRRVSRGRVSRRRVSRGHLRRK